MVLALLGEVEILLTWMLDEVAFTLEAAHGAAVAVRRKVLDVLTSRERTTRDDLAETLAATVPAADARRLEIALHHNHLPRLADEGYIDYDPRTGAVVRWTDPATIDAVLDSPAESD